MNVHDYPDTIQTILRRPRNGAGGGIPLTRGEVAMLFLDGFAGDGPDLLDVRSQGYGDDAHWDDLTREEVLEDGDTVFVLEKWESFELWPDQEVELVDNAMNGKLNNTSLERNSNN